MSPTPCAIQPCRTPVTNVLGYTCRGGHDEIIRVCERDALKLMRGNDAPGQPCPTEGCNQPAWYVIWCGFCRKGAHGDCRAMKGATRVMQGLPVVQAEQYCACTCDPALPLVAGAGYARDLDYTTDPEETP